MKLLTHTHVRAYIHRSCVRNNGGQGWHVFRCRWRNTVSRGVTADWFPCVKAFALGAPPISTCVVLVSLKMDSAFGCIILVCGEGMDLSNESYAIVYACVCWATTSGWEESYVHVYILYNVSMHMYLSNLQQCIGQLRNGANNISHAILIHHMWWDAFCFVIQLLILQKNGYHIHKIVGGKVADLESTKRISALHMITTRLLRSQASLLLCIHIIAHGVLLTCITLHGYKQPLYTTLTIRGIAAIPISCRR